MAVVDRSRHGGVRPGRLGVRVLPRRARALRLHLAVSPAPTLPDVPQLLAGAAEVDITPPPGLPKAGYSRNATDGTGFRTRLRARVVHLRRGASSLAIVATDLLGGSAVLQHQVAARVARTDVPLHGLLIGATHTHGAPGQFHGSDFYNRFSANRPGFDPDWTQFLVEQISDAVIRAVASRAPATLGWGRVAVSGFTRNRSMPAYRRNAGQAGAQAGEAVNPWLDLLRVDTAAGQPLAALAVYSIHGTAIPASARPYSADLWAYLCTRLGDRIVDAGQRRPVVGALQGTHGDVTPALVAAAGHGEAARIGRGLADAAADLYARIEPTADVDLGSAMHAVDLAQRPRHGGVRLPRRPAVGAALIAGARENLTPVVSALPLIRAGQGKRWSRSEQGAKWVLGSRWLQPLVLPLGGFPRVLPVHLLRIGPVLLTGLPMEITTESGRLVVDAAHKAWPAAAGGPGRVVVTSVADEYAGYCTTQAEYGAQFYEGGHTLYGPWTQRFLAGCVAELTTQLARGNTQLVRARSVDLAVRRYLPRPAVPVHLSPAGPPEVLGIGDVRWSWHGPRAGAVRWHETLVTVEHDADGAWRPVVQPGGRQLDDGHGDLEVQMSPRRSGGAKYSVRWYAAEVGSVPADMLPGAATAPGYRFRLTAAAGGPGSAAGGLPSASHERGDTPVVSAPF